MSNHPREHEELLTALLAGERAPTDPEVERRLRECPECAREWAQVQDARRRLETVAAEADAALDEISELRDAPGEERVLPILQRLAAETPYAPRRRPALGRWLAAAAVLLSFAWLLGRSLSDSGNDEPPTTLGPRLEIRAPRGEVTSYAPFSWTYPAGADRYEVRVYDALDTTLSTSLLTRRLKETSWTPDEDQLRGLPGRIVVVVEALDAFGNVKPAGSDSAEAWLSR